MASARLQYIFDILKGDNTLGPELDKIQKQAESLNKSFDNVKAAFAGISAAVTGFKVARSLKETVQIFKDLGGLFSIVSKRVLDLSKGFIGFIELLYSASGGLVILGTQLKKSDSEFVRMAGSAALIAGIISGTFATAIIFATKKIGQLVNALGTDLVNAFKRSVSAFADANKKAVIFNRTIDGFNKVLDGAIGNSETWNSVIEDITRNSTFFESAIQSSITELVAAGSQLGLNRQQMERLLKVSVDYATFSKRDLLQTTIDFINALNGQSQSVIKYGVKLSEASVKQKLLQLGITKSYAELTEYEKVQVRFNSLLKQYVPIAGTAADVNDTLAAQDKKLENNIKRLNIALGEGAAKIENLNIVNKALNVGLESVNTNVISFFGTIGALGARILQVGGKVLELSFTVLALKKAFDVLGVAISSAEFRRLAQVQLPVIKQSFDQIVASVSGTATKVTSLKSLFTVVVSSIVLQMKLFIKYIGVASKAVLGFVAGFITFKSIGIVGLITGIIVALKSLYDAISEVELRTGAFSTVVEVLGKTLAATGNVLTPVITLFTKLRNSVTNLADKAFGRLTQAIANVTNKALSLLKLNPFNLFGKESIKKIDNTQKKLQKFSEEIDNVDGKFSKLKPFKIEFKPPKKDEFKNLKEDIDDIDNKLGRKRKFKVEVDGKTIVNFVDEFGRVFQDSFITNIQNIGGFIEKGAEGAQEMFKALSTSIGQAFGAYGVLISGVINLLSAGPEKVREMVRSFTAALPVIVENIIASIPVFIDESIKGMNRAVERLAERSDVIAENFVKSFIKASPSIAEGLFKSLIDTSLTFGFRKKMKEILSDAFDGGFRDGFNSVKDFIKNGLVDVLEKAFEAPGNLVKKLFKYDGGGRGAVEKFLGFDFPYLKFSKGGLVAGKSVTSGDSTLNDNVPALLSPGEIVLPKSAVNAGMMGITKFLKGIGVQQFGLGGIVESVTGALASGGLSLINSGSGALGSFLTNITGTNVLTDLLSGTIGGVDKITQYLNQFIPNLGFNKYPGQDFLDVMSTLLKLGAKMDMLSFLINPKSEAEKALKSISSVFKPNFMQLLQKPMALGGEVPTGFPNDSFSAGLTSGENVIDRSTNAELKQFLQEGNQRTNDLLVQVISLLSQPQVVQSTVELNNQAFADVILELSRTNARLA